MLAMLRARHEDRKDLSDENVILDAARTAGLDMARFREDMKDPTIIPETGKSHMEAVEEHGVFGVPTFIFPNGASAFVKAYVPPDEDAVSMFEDLTDVMSKWKFIGEVKRPQPPWPKGVFALEGPVVRRATPPGKDTGSEVQGPGPAGAGPDPSIVHQRGRPDGAGPRFVRQAGVPGGRGAGRRGHRRAVPPLPGPPRGAVDQAPIVPGQRQHPGPGGPGAAGRAEPEAGPGGRRPAAARTGTRTWRRPWRPSWARPSSTGDSTMPGSSSSA